MHSKGRGYVQGQPDCRFQRKRSEEGGNSILPQCPIGWTPWNWQYISINQTRLLVAKYAEQYVKGCAACQANKINMHPLKPARIPITPVSGLPFQTVAMDIITKLPKSANTTLSSRSQIMTVARQPSLFPVKRPTRQKGWQHFIFDMSTQDMGYQLSHNRSGLEVYIKICKGTLWSIAS